MAGPSSATASIVARNCLVSNCGKNIALAKGGNYQFTHCTVVSFSNSYMLHRDPVLYVSNYITINNVPVALDLTAAFRNCIFWGQDGTVEDEVVVRKEGATTFAVSFNDILWKVVNAPSNITSMRITNNADPLFDTINTTQRLYSFRLKDNSSPAKDKATNLGINIDLDGNPRPVGPAPDLGCYEKQ